MRARAALGRERTSGGVQSWVCIAATGDNRAVQGRVSQVYQLRPTVKASELRGGTQGLPEGLRGRQEEETTQEPVFFGIPDINSPKPPFPTEMLRILFRGLLHLRALCGRGGE